MTTTDSPINLEIESQHSPQQSATPRTSTGIILATAVIFTLVGATAMWG